MSDFRVRAILHHWSGHGEGGNIAMVVLDKSYGTYHSTPDEIAESHRDAQRINELLSEGDAGACRYNCRTAKENWIEGFIAGGKSVLAYGQLGIRQTAEEKYREWKRKQA